jgi:hypothetical protein
MIVFESGAGVPARMRNGRLMTARRKEEWL